MGHEVMAVPNFKVAQFVTVMVDHEYKVDTYAITWERRDTDFTYMIYTEKRIPKAKLATIRAYISGVVAYAKFTGHC